MDLEFDALQQNETWTLVDLDPSQNVLSCKWVFRLKIGENGKIDRYKACLVANGMRQRDGIDVTETFVIVIKPTSVKIILSLTVTWGWELR